MQVLEAAVAANPWPLRRARGAELAERYPHAGEMLRLYQALTVTRAKSPPPRGGGGGGGGLFPPLSRLRRVAAAVVLRRFRRSSGQRPALPRLLALCEQLDLLPHDLRRVRRGQWQQTSDLPGAGAVPSRPRRRLPDVPKVSAHLRPAP